MIPINIGKNLGIAGVAVSGRETAEHMGLGSGCCCKGQSLDRAI